MIKLPLVIWETYILYDILYMCFSVFRRCYYKNDSKLLIPLAMHCGLVGPCVSTWVLARWARSGGLCGLEWPDFSLDGLQDFTNATIDITIRYPCFSQISFEPLQRYVCFTDVFSSNRSHTTFLAVSPQPGQPQLSFERYTLPLGMHPFGGRCQRRAAFTTPSKQIHGLPDLLHMIWPDISRLCST